MNRWIPWFCWRIYLRRKQKAESARTHVHTLVHSLVPCLVVVLLFFKHFYLTHIHLIGGVPFFSTFEWSAAQQHNVNEQQHGESWLRFLTHATFTFTPSPSVIDLLSKTDWFRKEIEEWVLYLRLATSSRIELACRAKREEQTRAEKKNREEQTRERKRQTSESKSKAANGGKEDVKA